METVKIIQGQNGQGENVALFTPIHAVYVNSSERLDDTVDNINTTIIDFSASTTEQFAEYSALTDSKIADLSANTQNKFEEYKSDFDSYSGETNEVINEIYNATFPVTLVFKQTSLETTSLESVSVSACTLQKNALVNANSLKIRTRFLNGTTKIAYSYTNTSSTDGYQPIPLSGNYFTIIANSEVPSRGETLINQESYTGYVYGYAIIDGNDDSHAEYNSSNSKYIFSLNTTTRLIRNSSFTITVNNTGFENYYLWFFAPTNKEIKKMTSSGIDVSYINPTNAQSFTISNSDNPYLTGNYFAYRTTNKLIGSSWEITISI